VAVLDGFTFFVFLVVVVVPAAVAGEPSCAFSVKTSEDLLSDFLPILQECCCFVVASVASGINKNVNRQKSTVSFEYSISLLFFLSGVTCGFPCPVTDGWSSL